MSTETLDHGLEAFRGAAVNAARSLGLPLTDVDDILQDAWLSLQRVDLDPSRNSDGMVATVIRRRAIDLARQRSRRETTVDLDATDLDQVTYDGPRDGDFTETFADRDEAACLLRWLCAAYEQTGLNLDVLHTVFRIALHHDGNVPAAARTMSLTDAQARSRVREVRESAETIRAARRHADRGPVDVLTVLTDLASTSPTPAPYRNALPLIEHEQRHGHLETVAYARDHHMPHSTVRARWTTARRLVLLIRFTASQGQDIGPAPEPHINHHTSGTKVHCRTFRDGLGDTNAGR
ncbi:sigma factor [Citricoccus sp.]|uniref:sigma factor n=1 Tax=Citricoccus sp. TaxID=1978372 RepID=UPI0026242348|nr:sigma factor [Citricoccus sp.]HRO31281.1 sigma factor [Citricoccus sp.]